MFNEFEVEGRSLDECERKAKALYGPNARIGRTEVVKPKGLLRLVKQETVRGKGFVVQLAKKPPDPEEERKKILSEAAKITHSDPNVRQILEEVRSLHEKIDNAAASAAMPLHGISHIGHPNIEYISNLLEENDFLPVYRKKITERIRKELSVETIEDKNELEQRVLAFIGETISLFNHEKSRKMPRIIVLIGPTGVGKTTTIARLAMKFIIENGMEPRKISLITTDHYRVAALQQLERYAELLGSPFAAPSNSEELKKEFDLQRENADIILVDTMGRSPRDSVVLGEMMEMLKVCGAGAELHLAVAAPTKAADIIDITAQFEPFRYESVIVTKLDESMRAGNVISALAERGKCISFITDGQDSTLDTIHKADIIRLLINLEGFEADRERLEETFR